MVNKLILHIMTIKTVEVHMFAHFMPNKNASNIWNLIVDGRLWS